MSKKKDKYKDGENSFLRILVVLLIFVLFSTAVSKIPTDIRQKDKTVPTSIDKSNNKKEVIPSNNTEAVFTYANSGEIWLFISAFVLGVCVSIHLTNNGNTFVV